MAARIDWVKVARALDDEWHSKRELAEKRPNDPDRAVNHLLSRVAFMLRDCLTAGMTQADRDRVFER